MLIKATEKKKMVYVERYQNIIIENREYMQIGFDDKSVRGCSLDQRQKHYRFVLNEPLESYYEKLHGHPLGLMNEEKIRRGKFFSDESSAANLLRKISTEDSFVGSFKGNMFIEKYTGDE